MQTLRALTARIVCICLTISIESQGCKNAQPVLAAPASMPASLPSEFLLIDAGQRAPLNGFFITEDGARRELRLRELESLSYRLQINDANKHAADSDAERDAALKEAHRNDWCIRWCLEIGIFTGLVVGGVAGGFLGKSLSRP